MLLILVSNLQQSMVQRSGPDSLLSPSRRVPSPDCCLATPPSLPNADPPSVIEQSMERLNITTIMDNLKIDGEDHSVVRKIYVEGKNFSVPRIGQIFM